MLRQCSLASYAYSTLLCQRATASFTARNVYTRAKAAAAMASPKGKAPANPARVFRSRHLDPEQEPRDKSQMKMLEPYTLSSRLKKLCEANKIDDAVAMLKNAPLDAQNTPVWNTLIWECMKAHRFQLAYKLFTDMKRRGFSPTTRTFQTMFSGLARVEDWSAHTKQLANARSLYESYKKHVASVKFHDKESSDLSVQPLTHYLTILGNVGYYQEMFDVYYAMDQEGPLSPDQFIYSAMFSALARRPASLSDVPSATFYEKSAENAKLLWRQMEKAVAKDRVQVDPFIIGSAVAALARGRTGDQELAFKILADYHGLTPGQTSPLKPSDVKIPITSQSFASVLLLCSKSEKYALADQFFQSVKALPESHGGPGIIDRAHMEEIMKARLALPTSPGIQNSSTYCLELLEWMLKQEIIGQNGPRIRPANSTYNLVISACWRDADWRSVVRVFELITGYHGHDFMDGAVNAEPRLDRRAKGRNLQMNAEGVSAMLKVALSSRQRGNVRQCLRIIRQLGPEELLRLKKGSTRGLPDSKKKVKNESFFAGKLAAVILEAVDYVSVAPAKTTAQHEELQNWEHLKKLAESAQIGPKPSKPRSRKQPL